MSVRSTFIGSQNVGIFTPRDLIQSLPWGWLGYAQVTTAQTGITVETALTGLGVTVNVGANRRLKITSQGMVDRTVADGLTIGWWRDEIGNVIGTWSRFISSLAGDQMVYNGHAVITPSTAGVHTYYMTLQRNSGTGTVRLYADANTPAFILVEDIGPAS